MEKGSRNTMAPKWIHSKRAVLGPVAGSPWASEMVLNPAIIQDRRTGRIHMLFRATGPWAQKRLEGRPLPYPIFLGYGWSNDNGETWGFDLLKPALAPRLEYDSEKIRIENYRGEKVVDYANGSIEDPRLFYFENECYMTAACRMFPPGPYWEHDDPTQCCPDWVGGDRNPFGRAASENVTVSVLYRVDLDRLSQKRYSSAFQYVANLTDPEFGEDRDAVIFPERLRIGGDPKIVMLHRPFCPTAYPADVASLRPSVFICAADRFEDFSDPNLGRRILAVPEYDWERDRIGASAPPIRIGPTEWLLGYHGKQDAIVGYTQSFMILKEDGRGMPEVSCRCPERLITADLEWERAGKFSTPCVFITGMVRLGERLLMSYGAADEKVGLLEADLKPLIEYLRTFPVG